MAFYAAQHDSFATSEVASIVVLSMTGDIAASVPGTKSNDFRYALGGYAIME